jgi:hypothetical protein
MIIDRTKTVSTPSSDPEEIAQAGLLAQMGMMRRALWASPERNPLLLLAICIFLVISATAYGQIRLNSWNQPFYDALSHRNLHGFVEQLGIFGIIAGALLALNVAQRWFGETLKLRLRQGLVQDLVEKWMVPGRASIRTNACTRMRAISPSFRGIWESACFRPRCCLRRSSTYYGPCPAPSPSTWPGGRSRYLGIWCGPPSCIPGRRRS